MSLLYGKVTFRAQAILADLVDDADELPNVAPVVGHLEFTPTRQINYDTRDGVMKIIEPVVAGLDADGVLRDASGNPSVTLTSPQSPDLIHRDWQWEVTFRLSGTQVLVGPYRFDLNPNQVRNLAALEIPPTDVTEELIVLDFLDGTASLNGGPISDNGDGSFIASSDSAVADNGDGTYSIAS